MEEQEVQSVDRQKAAIRKAIDRIRQAAACGLNDARMAARKNADASLRSMDAKSAKGVELAQCVFEKTVNEALLPLLAQLDKIMGGKNDEAAK